MLVKTWLSLLGAAAAVQAAKPKEKPNIVLIFTDDQDARSFERKYLPKIYEHLVDQGVKYDNFFTPVSICCPSRVSLFRAQYAHNHNITYVNAPWGGWDIFNDYGYVGHTLPDFLQQAGYTTYYTGKYMNAHTVKNCVSKPVSGFTSSDFLVDPYTYDYWNPAFSRDNGPAEILSGQYSTDVVRDKGLAYIDDGIASGKPFFVGIAPIAPHSAITYGGPKTPNSANFMAVPEPAPRHAHLFPDEIAHRVDSFNPDKPAGASWVKQLPKLNETQVEYIDEFYRGRLQALQAVDELVEDVVKKLEENGELDNTYIFYTADNGFALGTHRRQPGKTLGYEEDITVPFVVRGPKVPKGKTDTLSSYGIVDLSRTILDIAGAKPDYLDDGVVINLHNDDDDSKQAQHALARHSLSEFWVYGIEEGIYAGVFRENSTYRTLRYHDEGATQLTYSYSVWCTGERELYDLKADPYQLNNLLGELNDQGPFAAFDSLPADVQRATNRLDAVTLVLKTCEGEACGNPWDTLFAGGKVSTLAEALKPEYDEYFVSLPKVHFDECALGYQARREEPLWQDEWAFKPSNGGAKAAEDKKQKVLVHDEI